MLIEIQEIKCFIFIFQRSLHQLSNSIYSHKLGLISKTLEGEKTVDLNTFT